MREAVGIQSPVIQEGGYAQELTPVEAASQLLDSQRYEPMPTVLTRLNTEVMPEWLRNVHGLVSTSPDVPCSQQSTVHGLSLDMLQPPASSQSQGSDGMSFQSRTELIQHCGGLGLPKPEMGASAWDRFSTQQHVNGICPPQQPCGSHQCSSPVLPLLLCHIGCPHADDDVAGRV